MLALDILDLTQSGSLAHSRAVGGHLSEKATSTGMREHIPTKYGVLAHSQAVRGHSSGEATCIGMRGPIQTSRFTTTHCV